MQHILAKSLAEGTRNHMWINYIFVYVCVHCRATIAKSIICICHKDIEVGTCRKQAKRFAGGSTPSLGHVVTTNSRRARSWNHSVTMTRKSQGGLTLLGVSLVDRTRKDSRSGYMVYCVLQKVCSPSLRTEAACVFCILLRKPKSSRV